MLHTVKNNNMATGYGYTESRFRPQNHQEAPFHSTEGFSKKHLYNEPESYYYQNRNHVDNEDQDMVHTWQHSARNGKRMLDPASSHNEYQNKRHILAYDPPMYLRKYTPNQNSGSREDLDTKGLYKRYKESKMQVTNVNRQTKSTANVYLAPKGHELSSVVGDKSLPCSERGYFQGNKSYNLAGNRGNSRAFGFSRAALSSVDKGYPSVTQDHEAYFPDFYTPNMSYRHNMPYIPKGVYNERHYDWYKAKSRDSSQRKSQYDIGSREVEHCSQMYTERPTVVDREEMDRGIHFAKRTRVNYKDENTTAMKCHTGTEKEGSEHTKSRESESTPTTQPDNKKPRSLNLYGGVESCEVILDELCEALISMKNKCNTTATAITTTTATTTDTINPHTTNNLCIGGNNEIKKDSPKSDYEFDYFFREKTRPSEIKRTKSEIMLMKKDSEFEGRAQACDEKSEEYGMQSLLSTYNPSDSELIEVNKRLYEVEKRLCDLRDVAKQKQGKLEIIISKLNSLSTRILGLGAHISP
ncbi:hypothetical protein AX774_g6191 [Zancudomyces culisetae]|uniref:Uncharacterized protein n=1 Tax=Zancudomyces culisetae TaxID=1213189 RepID=A0A1R1PHH5_ZANCU|nr:hypothetical protein AX774_g6191 [Zancudomyces culisetae]|eukprot:OMH80379.1 hypothetical protein AX774_g6191 [Zancudomyces culisetae]